MRRTAIPILAFLAAATAPAEPPPPPDVAMQALHAQDQLVEAVGYRLATANADLCVGAKPNPGFVVQTLEQYDRPYRAAAAQALGLGEWPGVTAVAPDAPAEAAGLRVGDALTAVNDIALPRLIAQPAKGDFGRTEKAQRLLADKFAPGHAVLSIVRAGHALTVDVTALPACPGEFEVVTDNEMNSDADGAHVQISSRMVALTQSDADLAAVLAHELAHNVLRHRMRLDALHVSRGLLGQFGRNASLIRQTESEADRLGIYLLARAGYSPAAAMDFWHRLRASVRTWGDTTHPGWKERLAAMQAETDRIRASGSTGRAIQLPDDLRRLIPTTP